MTKVDIHKKAMIEALTKSLGIVTTACNVVGISRQSHYDWYNEDADYKKAVDDVADIALDFAESKLHKQIDKEDTTATIFYLKTKGKKRGYIERNEFDLLGLPKNININVTTPESAKELKKFLDAKPQ